MSPVNKKGIFAIHNGKNNYITQDGGKEAVLLNYIFETQGLASLPLRLSSVSDEKIGRSFSTTTFKSSP